MEQANEEKWESFQQCPWVMPEIMLYGSIALMWHGEKEKHAEEKFEYQRNGIGTAIVKHGLEVAKSLVNAYLQLNLFRVGLMARTGFLVSDIMIYLKLKNETET